MIEQQVSLVAVLFVLISRARSYGNLDSAVVNSWHVAVHSWLAVVLVVNTRTNE